MNKRDVATYARRWAMVAEADRREVAQMSPAEKFADQAMLMATARALGSAADPDEDTGAELVRQRWILLAERFGA